MARQRFRDQVVLITGASSGIGEATAKAFAREGAVVALAARREGALRRVAREIEAAGGRAMVAPLDVSSSESVRAMVADVVGEFGRIDVVFNNAGVSLVGRSTQRPSLTTLARCWRSTTSARCAWCGRSCRS